MGADDRRDLPRQARTYGSDALAAVAQHQRGLRWVHFRRGPWRISPTGLWALLIGLLLVFAAFHEIRTSALQSEILSAIASKLSYRVEPGRSDLIVYPRDGPFDKARGYALLPDFTRRLEARGYQVSEQALFSPAAMRLARWGISLPYPEPSVTGLLIRDASGRTLYDARPKGTFFESFAEVPPLVVDALLFIENRELLAPPDPRTNPAVDWGRFAKAGINYAGGKLGLPVRTEGGSTLATQLEKYRHSPGGRTSSAIDKLRQMTAASIGAYRSGLDTRDDRQQIALDYLNTVPLASAPRFGEVHGLGQGLRVWFGMSLDAARSALEAPGEGDSKAEAYKHVLALLCAVQGPTHYLVRDRAALEARVNTYINMLAKAGRIDADFARRLGGVPLRFEQGHETRRPTSFLEQKASAAGRTKLLRLLGLPGLYDLDRLDLEVHTSVDADLQAAARGLFEKLRDPGFLDKNGLRQERLLSKGDPRNVLYSLLLYERTPEGNMLRAQTDNLDQPFDMNRGMKLELGSTAKLRTLAHYLELVARLHEELGGLDGRALQRRALTARDPITSWAIDTLLKQRGLDLESFLGQSLARTYSASPHEVFFTGAGEHTFANFESSQDGLIMTVREALVHSTNLVYIRLMRDLVRFHEARLPYDTSVVLDNPNHPDRVRMLEEIADEESQSALSRAYKAYHKQARGQIASRLLGRNTGNLRDLAILFYAWHHGPDATGDALARWMKAWVGDVSPPDIARLERAYSNPRLDIADYGYLLGRHPLEVWCAGELAREPDMTWEALLSRSVQVRRVASAWLFRTRNRDAQDLRLRIRFEKDAFARMTPYWRKLGFPFERLVPSYATALGSSADRPEALAELMGILVNDGERLPTRVIRQLRFAAGTPYHTIFDAETPKGERVMNPTVARMLRDVLAQVVDEGTAARVKGAFAQPDGTPVVAGGKTGSGDNRFKSFARNGTVISSHAVNRTATFVFFVGDRYFGVVTASVLGGEADQYGFTSSLPLAVLKLLAPEINRRLPPDVVAVPGERVAAR